MEHKTGINIDAKDVIAAGRSFLNDLNHNSSTFAKVNNSSSKQSFNVTASHVINISENEYFFNSSL